MQERELDSGALRQQDTRTADTALDTIEQASADYIDSLNTEREAIVDAITPTPEDSPRTIAEKTRLRSIGGELLTMGNNMWAYWKNVLRSSLRMLLFF